MIPREILKKIRQIELRTNRLVSETLGGQYHSVFKGQGMNFDEVREYQPGDEVRTIDWNVTARMNHPFVKKFVEERELTLMLVVDVSGSGLFGSTDQSKRELAAEVACLLAFSAIRNNDKVGLILFTDRVELFIPPKKGRSHTLRLIREILFFQPQGRGTLPGLALDYLNRVSGNSNPTVGRAPVDADDIAVFAGTGLTPAGAVLTVSDRFINLLPQTEKSRRFLVSIARPDGPSQGLREYRFATESFAASIATTSFLSSMFTNTMPFPSATENSGFPPRAIVPATLPVLASMAVELLERPLKVKTRPETPS